MNEMQKQTNKQSQIKQSTHKTKTNSRPWDILGCLHILQLV